MKFDRLHVCLQMDKVSILGDAIDYVIELKKELMDIETRLQHWNRSPQLDQLESATQFQT